MIFLDKCRTELREDFFSIEFGELGGGDFSANDIGGASEGGVAWISSPSKHEPFLPFFYCEKLGLGRECIDK